MRWIPAVAVVGLAMTATACWGDKSADGPTQPATEAVRAAGPSGTASGTPPTVAVPEEPVQHRASAGRTSSSGRPDLAERPAFREIRAGIRNSPQWRNAAWVGETHTDMMNEFVDNRQVWLTANRASQCQLLVDVTLKYLVRMQQERSVFAGRDQRTLAARFVRDQRKCAAATPMSVTGVPAPAMSSYVYSPADGEPVTGAYQPYVGQIEAAVQNGNTPWGIASAIDAIVASATGIPNPDLQVVYAVASLALETSYYWYDYENTIGWTGEAPAIPFSMFGAAAYRDWRTGATVDVVSCAIGVADKLFLGGGGPVGWGILAGACALYGGGGSLLYAIS